MKVDLTAMAKKCEFKVYYKGRGCGVAGEEARYATKDSQVSLEREPRVKGVEKIFRSGYKIIILNAFILYQSGKKIWGQNSC